jgi:hypothetical protein
LKHPETGPNAKEWNEPQWLFGVEVTELSTNKQHTHHGY